LNWIRKAIFAVILISIIILLSFTHIGRYIFWNYANIDDHNKFPAVTIKKAGSSYYFTNPDQELPPKLPVEYDPEGGIAFDEFLEEKQSVAFAIIQHDTILYERFFDDYSRGSILTSFSISKSFISALLGIALAEGSIKSIDQPVTDYLDGFKYPGFDKITIRNLIEMRSGIYFNESYSNPFGHAAKYYYGKDLKKYTYRLKPVNPPDSSYEYSSGNTQILGLVLESATGMSLPEYLERTIWTKVGMEYDGSWNLDSEKHKTVKAFCCLNASFYDFAKFGKLYLDRGKWDNEEIIPGWWIEESLKIQNDSRDDDGYPYTFGWRSLETGSFFAKGIMGQYIYINPAKELVILRFGKSYAGIEWANLFEKIADQY
jgi:CubicO group peptidase (beta-lactamase class C family)